jgi:hypothetical protein
VVPEVAVILANKQFYPSRIRLKDGVQTRLFFTTINEKPAAVVVEKLQIQKWVSKEVNSRQPASEQDRAKWEATREVTKDRITEILMEPLRGSYSFHDVITGAKGQITVE